MHVYTISSYQPPKPMGPAPRVNFCGWKENLKNAYKNLTTLSQDIDIDPPKNPTPPTGGDGTADTKKGTTDVEQTKDKGPIIEKLDLNKNKPMPPLRDAIYRNKVIGARINVLYYMWKDPDGRKLDGIYLYVELLPNGNRNPIIFREGNQSNKVPSYLAKEYAIVKEEQTKTLAAQKHAELALAKEKARASAEAAALASRASEQEGVAKKGTFLNLGRADKKVEEVKETEKLKPMDLPAEDNNLLKQIEENLTNLEKQEVNPTNTSRPFKHSSFFSRPKE